MLMARIANIGRWGYRGPHPPKERVECEEWRVELAAASGARFAMSVAPNDY